MNFDGKVVLVTGASRGIGAAIARAFAAEGACVVVNYLQRHDAAEAVVADCRRLGTDSGGQAIAVQGDVTCPDQSRAIVERILLDLGRIDVLVNNAFAPYRFDPETRSRFWETTWSNYQTQFDGAVRAAWNLCQAVVPGMRQRAGGSIINLITDLVENPVLPYHDYATAKSALQGFSRNLAAELGAFGIRVNCVAPGLVMQTEASRPVRESFRQSLAGQTPLRRVAAPEDVAGPVLFLASDWSGFVTGQTIVVDGGLVMR